MRKKNEKYLPLLLFFLIGFPLFAQKPVLNASVFHTWTGVMGGAISNDGNYVWYSINNLPIGSQTSILQATSGNWKKELPGVNDLSITSDSRKALFFKAHDTLCLLTLGTSVTEDIPDVAGYRLFKQGKKELIAVQKTGLEKNNLVLHNLATGKVLTFPNVGLYLLSEDGKAMAILRSLKDSEGHPFQMLDWVDLVTRNTRTIWQGKGNATNFVFDNAKQLAYTIEELVNKKNEKSIWLYRSGATKAVRFDADPRDRTDLLKVEALTNFSKDGNRLFMKLKKSEPINATSGAVKVDIWSYTDPKLQSQQLKDLEPPRGLYGAGIVQQNFIAVVDFNRQKRIQLVQEYEYCESLFNDKTDDWLVIKQDQDADVSEAHWSRAAKTSWFLASTKNGQRQQLPGYISNISPDGRYALGQDSDGDIYSYELLNGIIHYMTKMLPVSIGDGIGDRNNDMPSGLKTRGFIIAGWLSDSKSVIVYDRYDIWQLDPLGSRPPVNLTNSYGRKQKIVFRFAEDVHNKKIVNNQQLILTAFIKDTKENGFYKMTFSKNQNPELLTKGPYVYYVPGTFMGSSPLKAKYASTYLVQRESASESPNYFATKDFKTFRRLSSVYPEKEYNWMISELVSFKTLEGKDEQGVLYKPRNFDPRKKYPVIINYYERKTDGLNIYHRPGAASNEINIPWFVSRGYLVFTPDIHYTIGNPGESALNSVVGATNHLKILSYINGDKIGIQGHSFGGFETNYIITHSSLFAAAVTAAGPSDLISMYNDLWGTGNSKQAAFELDQMRIGFTLWERPELYLRNSPIFLANKVTTPLLMMHNKEDGAVSFHQGVEFFTALRRLGKRVWMLQYDGQGHSVSNKKASVDYTLRMTQFFDHYLKGAPAPQWMLRGIPAKLKGVDDGLSLDTTGATPGRGLLIEEKKKPD